MLSQDGKTNLAKGIASGSTITEKNYGKFYMHIFEDAMGKANVTYDEAMTWAKKQLNSEVNSIQHLIQQLTNKGY